MLRSSTILLSFVPLRSFLFFSVSWCIDPFSSRSDIYLEVSTMGPRGPRRHLHDLFRGAGEIMSLHWWASVIGRLRERAASSLYAGPDFRYRPIPAERRKSPNPWYIRSGARYYRLRAQDKRNEIYFRRQYVPSTFSCPPRVLPRRSSNRDIGYLCFRKIEAWEWRVTDLWGLWLNGRARPPIRLSEIV